MLDSLVRVSRRAGDRHLARILTVRRRTAPRRSVPAHSMLWTRPVPGAARPRPRHGAHCLGRARGVPRGPPPVPASLPRPQPILTCRVLAMPHPPERLGKYGPRATACNRFPFSNFRYFFTLSSEFFSSFPHGTCSLSVSCLYLALDGIYHPLRPAFPSKPTRRRRLVRCRATAQNGVVTLPDALFQGTSTVAAAQTDSLGHNPRRPGAAAVPGLSSSRFTRRYWGNPC